MPSNLTGSRVSDVYDQLLHVSDGPTATEKVVYSGVGVATALKLATGSASVDNIKLDGNTISSTNTDGNINLSPNGSGTVAFSKANITGGSITGVTVSGLTGDLGIADGGTGASTAATARSNLGIGTSGTFNLAYGEFFSTADQTATANTATTLTFTDSAAFNTGVSLVSSSRLTCTSAGVYEVTVSIQFANSAAADHTASFWFRKNGADIANSASLLVVPKTGDGGVMFSQVSLLEQVTDGQYFEVVWATTNAAVTVDFTAASGASPVRPAVPSVIAVVKRIA